jgi:hypothetical protein
VNPGDLVSIRKGIPGGYKSPTRHQGYYFMWDVNWEDGGSLGHVVDRIFVKETAVVLEVRPRGGIGALNILVLSPRGRCGWIDSGLLEAVK